MPGQSRSQPHPFLWLLAAALILALVAAALERGTVELDAAATDLDGYLESTSVRLAAVEATLDDVIDRMELTRRGDEPEGPRVS